MSTLALIFIVGFLLIAAGSVLALLFAVKTAEDGYEDATGFHSTGSSQAKGALAPTVDTGNPWDQIEGACCPLELGHSLRHNPVHQP